MESENPGREPDIKTFMNQLISKIEKISRDIHSSKQESLTVTNLSRSIEHKISEECTSMTNETLSDLDRVKRDFYSLVKEEKSDNNHTKQQLASVVQEKLKLEQKLLLLETRVTELEKEIGIDIILPSIP